MKKIIALVLISAGLIFVFYDGVLNKTTQTEFFSMATFAKLKIYGYNGEKCAREIEEQAENLENNVISPYIEGSEVYNANRSGVLKASEMLAPYLELLEDVAVKSGGKYNYALGCVSDLWGFSSSGTGTVPNENELAEAIENAKATYSDGTLTVGEGARVDLASSGKGIALDEAKKCLEKYKIRSAVISFGGSVLLYGNRDFKVGIRYPDSSNTSQIAVIETRNCCVSTSGSYLQSFEINGVTYHHIFDPETGYPVQNGIKSVTVISDSGTLGDALSTACFVLGVEDGMKLADEYDCGIVIVTDGNKIIMNEKAALVTRITDSDFEAAN